MAKTSACVSFNSLSIISYNISGLKDSFRFYLLEMSNCDTADYLNRDVPIEYDTSEREYNKVLGHSDNEEIQQHWALVSIFEDGSVLTLEDSFGKCILEMSSASSCCFPKVPAEYDGTGRKAQFYLYTKPVQNAVLGHSDNEEMHHWALVAVFEDQSVRTLEGFIRCHGPLCWPVYL
uniref:Uncharacterized protein n=1 Tax=Rhodnius prolixus TaxID=13249 RepID=T1HPR2_RHOPR